MRHHHESPAPGSGDGHSPLAWMVVLWLLLALLAAARVWWTGLDEPHPLGFGEAALLESPAWLLWIGVTPLLARLARRYPPWRRPFGAALAAHGALWILTLGVSGLLGMAGLLTIATPPPGADLVRGYLDLVALRSLPTALVYGMVLAVVSSTDHQARLAQKRREEVELRANLALAELEALRARLHPHFLFNALQAVSTLIEEEPEAARCLVGRLALLLRRVVDGHEQELIPLRDEIELADAYLEIERARLGERLSTDVDVEPDDLGVPLPAFVLQPLVENAVLHGIAPRPGPGHVRIAVRRHGTDLRVTVLDDGMGLPPRLVEGVGLSVTRARLERRYGRDDLLVVGPGDNGGTRVELTIPVPAEPSDEKAP